VKKDEFTKIMSGSKKWKMDRFGHYIAESSYGGLFRLKVQTTSVRLEERVSIVGKNEWRKIMSTYFKHISFVDSPFDPGLKIDRLVVKI
jgi:hypothetical protein